MPNKEFLTLAELLSELHSTGVQIEERTVRYWTSRGLLPRPVKKPFRGADGRVGYYPSSTLNTIADVLRLQDEGWKIEQIRKFVLGSEQRVVKMDQTLSMNFSAKYLKELLSDHSVRERQEFLTSTNSDPGDIRRIRRQLVGRLERIVGRKEAVRAVSQFLLSLSKRQKSKLVHRLRTDRQSRVGSGETLFSERKLQWQNDERLKRFISKVENWSELPEVDQPPILGRRAQALVEKTKSLLSHMATQSGVNRKPLASKISELLEEIEDIAVQAEKNTIFLAATDGADTKQCQ